MVKSLILNTLSDSKILDQLQSGALAVIPTDTVYGVVARATDESAVARLYHLKRRESKPGTLIAASIDQLVDLGVKRRYLTAVENFWPNPLSVVIPCDLPYLDQGVRSLAMRLPKDEQLVALLKQTGPLITSSANQPGEPPATTVEEAIAYFGDDVAVYVDGGSLAGRPASTIIRVVDDAIEVLRAGALKIDESGKILS